MLGKLGIDARLLVWQMINFIILFLILRRFAWKPILAALKARAERVARGEQDAAEAKRALEQAEGERTQILNAARTQASAVLKAAEDDAHAYRASSTTKIDAEAKSFTAAARAGAIRERDELLKQAEGDIASLVTLAARKVLDDAAPDIKLDTLVARALKRT